MVQAYLTEFVSKHTKEVNGYEFAKLINQFHLAENDGFLQLYDKRLL